MIAQKAMTESIGELVLLQPPALCQYALCIANKCLSMQNCQSISQNGG